MRCGFVLFGGVKKMNRIYTVGLNGSNLDSFTNALNGIDTVIDVRFNPTSNAGRTMEAYGYHEKSGLEDLLGDKYIHLKGLGIGDKVVRGNAKISAEAFYEALKDYPFSEVDIVFVRKLLEDGKKVALLCQETYKDTCHRHFLARVLTNKAGIELDARK
jgi:uncharacterized protein (DUF488 family)